VLTLPHRLQSATAFSVSSSGRLLRAWSLTDGSLLWDSASNIQALDATASSPAAPFDAVCFGRDRSRVALLYRGVITAYAAESGQKLWTHNL
jgi:hypothetical protein